MIDDTGDEFLLMFHDFGQWFVEDCSMIVPIIFDEKQHMFFDDRQYLFDDW